ncbi:MAG: hypothetical protein ACQXXE_08860 [Candidatus Bathyarchaeia archaeon]
MQSLTRTVKKGMVSTVLPRIIYISIGVIFSILSYLLLAHCTRSANIPFGIFGYENLYLFRLIFSVSVGLICFKVTSGIQKSQRKKIQAFRAKHNTKIEFLRWFGLTVLIFGVFAYLVCVVYQVFMFLFALQYALLAIQLKCYSLGGILIAYNWLLGTGALGWAFVAFGNTIGTYVAQIQAITNLYVDATTNPLTAWFVKPILNLTSPFLGLM